MVLMCRLDHCLADRMRRSLRQRGGQAKQVLGIGQPVDLYRLQARMAAGQCAGLVEKHLPDPGQRLQGRAVLDQYPAPRRPRNA